MHHFKLLNASSASRLQSCLSRFLSSLWSCPFAATYWFVSHCQSPFPHHSLLVNIFSLLLVLSVNSPLSSALSVILPTLYFLRLAFKTLLFLLLHLFPLLYLPCWFFLIAWPLNAGVPGAQSGFLHCSISAISLLLSFMPMAISTSCAEKPRAASWTPLFNPLLQTHMSHCILTVSFECLKVKQNFYFLLHIPQTAPSTVSQVKKPWKHPWLPFLTDFTSDLSTNPMACTFWIHPEFEYVYHQN